VTPRLPITAALILLAFPSAMRLSAEDITTTGGQTYTNSTVRRVGDKLMIKVTMEGSSSSVEMALPLTQIAKVGFAEPPELAKVITAASKGNAATVISLTGDYVAKEGDLKDVPGSWWLEMARRRLPALASAGKDAECGDLARQIGAIKNPAAESLARGGALFSPLATSDLAAVLVGAKALPRLGGDMGSALAQLALGKALLQKKDFPGAIRAFLTIKVFYPSAALLQPPALAGAAEAYVGLKDEKRAAQCYEDIVRDWPDSPQAPLAKKKAATLAHP
jgi:tetratricopeptide (TPR) repeat protein